MRGLLSAFFAAAVLTAAAVPVPLLAATSDPEMVSPAKPLPPFALTDHRGLSFKNDRLAGKWSLVLLGYTHCPDICPFTMQNLAAVIEQLTLRVPPEKLPQVIFVGVDQERDKPVLADYVTAFNPDFIGVTGDWPAIKILVDGVGGFARIDKRKPGQEDYQVSHTAFVSVIDPEGRIAARLNPPMEPARTAAFLAKLMRDYGKAIN